MKRAIFIPVLFLLCAANTVFAQSLHEGHYGKKGYDVAYSAAATIDGGYIITGLTQSMVDSNGDIVVIKLDAECDTQWTMEYGGPLLEGGNFVMQTADSGYMVGGHTEDFGSFDCDAYLMKLDKYGNHVWFRHYGGEHDDICESVVELPEGGYVFSGITESYDNPDSSERRHIYLVKTNSTGDTVWTKVYAGKGLEYSYSLARMNDGGFLSVGFSSSYGKGEKDGQIYRLDKNGDSLWMKLYSSAGDTRFLQIIPTADNGFMIVGFTTLTQTCKTQGLVLKLDEWGNQVWEKIYGDTLTGMVLHGITQLPDNNYVITGANFDKDTLGQVYILSIDGLGNKIAENEYGGTNSIGLCIASQGNNSYLAAGQTIKYGDPLEDLYYLEMDYTSLGITAKNSASSYFYPNPLTGMSEIILPEPEASQVVKLEVTSANGRKIYSQSIMAKDIIINRSSLPAGDYIYHITCQDGKEYKGKFVVE